MHVFPKNAKYIRPPTGLFGVTDAQQGYYVHLLD